jgi:hypothetical protein
MSQISNKILYEPPEVFSRCIPRDATKNTKQRPGKQQHSVCRQDHYQQKQWFSSSVQRRFEKTFMDENIWVLHLYVIWAQPYTSQQPHHSTFF